MRKVFMFVNVDWFFLSHRLPIAKASEANNIEMVVYTDFTQPHDPEEFDGFKLHQSPVRRKYTSWFYLMLEALNSYRLIRKCKPDLIHAVTIKPILILGLVARLTATPFIGAISGFGPAFSATDALSSLRLRVIVYVFKFVFGGDRSGVICQSTNDRDTLLSFGICSAKKIALISGSGVDIELYSPNNKLVDCEPYVLMASRMLGDKGVREFCLAAKIVHAKLGREIKFKLSGPVDIDSPTFISEFDLKNLCADSEVEYLGNRQDMPELLASAVLFVLPSYYAEGVPKVLLEASACGVAIITTDHPGCRDAIVNRETGLLVQPRDSGSLANAIMELLANTDLATKMGEEGRKLAVSAYGDTVVVLQHYSLYRQYFS